MSCGILASSISGLEPKIGMSKRGSNRSIEVPLYLWLAEVKKPSAPDMASSDSSGLRRRAAGHGAGQGAGCWCGRRLGPEKPKQGSLDGPNSDPIDTLSFF